MEWNFNNDLPIYSQLMEQMTQAIVSGKIGPGEKLQSVRDIALEAGVNPNTVQRALADLEREGLVFSFRTTGRFVTEDTEWIAHKKMEKAEEKIREFLSQMEKLGCESEEIESLLAKIESEK